MEIIRNVLFCCFKKKKQLSSLEDEGSGKVELQGIEGEELATFGAGCYWGTEKYFLVNFQKEFPGSILG